MRLAGAAAALIAGLGLAGALASRARATVLSPWGSNLAATPALDTANGDYSNTGSTAGTGPRVIAPDPHEAEDTAIWNTATSAGSAFAPADGQALYVRVKGCAVEDRTAPTQQSPDGQGGTVPVNTIVLQTLTPDGLGDYVNSAVSGRFVLPFCNSVDAIGRTVTTSTITTFEPIHMCLKQGDAVAFHDIGGFIPYQGGAGPWYPQGMPFRVLAAVRASSTDSFVGVGTSTYGPGIYGQGEPDPKASGFASEPGQELMLQVVEGIGEDAYGLCPGGKANEPASPASNRVICVYERSSPEGYPTCDGNNNPVYPPAILTEPAISGSPVAGSLLTVIRGSWSNQPYAIRDQWQRCDDSGGGCTLIAGATSWSYRLTAADVGHRLRVVETATNQATTAGPVSSHSTAVITATSPTNAKFVRPPPAPTPPAPAPRLSGLRLTPAVVSNLRAARILYTDSMPARVTIRFISSRTRRTVKTLTRRDRLGSNVIRFPRGLAAGRYTVQLSATYGGRTSRRVTLSFTIRRPSARR